MRRYRFRLEQVRTVRRVQEEAARAELRRADLAADQASAAELARRARYAAECTALPVGAAQAFLADHERLARAAAGVEAAGRALADARLAAAEYRTVWSGAARRVAALDRLDDRQRADHAVEAARALDRQLDDVARRRTGDGDD